jgi:RNA-directed DNA polymerase
MGEGVGDAHSTEDNQDNITWKEGRGITIGNVLDNKLPTKLMKRSIQEKVQVEIDILSQKKRKDMTSRERSRLLQLKLYQKAKQESRYKFYILYDKIFLTYILEEAYKRCKSKRGSRTPGVDGVTFSQVEETGREAFLLEIKEELRKRTYKPKPVKRVMIEKANGGQRPLGIPTIKDRVVQQACKMVIEPIFEADFDESSHGFRPKRSAKDAMTEIKGNLKEGMHMVYDADLSKYFDRIPHDKLMVTLQERIADPRVLTLIKLWLKSPVVEEDGNYTGGKGHSKGTPQGGVISPLLANIYMNLIDRIVNRPNGYYDKRDIRMIRYADDFILMSKHINQEVLIRLNSYLKRMELTINKEKSKLLNARESSFDFLGFTVRYDRSILYSGMRFWNIKPKTKSERRVRQSINAKLREIGHYPAQKVASELNPILRGWMNYYKIEGISYTQVPFRKLDNYLRTRLDRYYNRKSQRKSRLHGQEAYRMLTGKYGLVVPYVSSGLRPVKAQRRNH